MILMYSNIELYHKLYIINITHYIITPIFFLINIEIRKHIE